MNFEIRPSESFNASFRELLNFSVQEAVLDLLDELREHPGDLIQRDLAPPIPGVLTRPVHVDVQGASFGFSVLFQYDSDESTIHLIYLLILDDAP